MNALPLDVIDVRDLRLDAGTRTLVEHLTLTVRRGERWVILGPNGAGKSSLLAVLAGLRCAEAGEVVIAGQDFGRWTVDALAARRALVTDRWLDPFAATALETVLTARYRFGADDADGAAPARDELAQLDCADLADHDVRTLSRGERQRVALATALAQDTPLVLQRLGRLAERTLVASTHDVNAAVRFATHVLLLSGQGRWRAGPTADCLTADALSELFGARFAAVPTADGPLFHLTHA